MKQQLHFKAMISFTSYLSSIEKSVTYDLLPKRKRINLGVIFSFFSNSKHMKPTQANTQSPKQSSHRISFLFAHLGENQSLKKMVFKRLSQ